jgi:hypothetical protein
MRHPDTGGRHRTQRGITSAARRLADDREDRQHAVADKFQHFAPEGVNRACDAIEPGAERRDDDGGRIAFR